MTAREEMDAILARGEYIDPTVKELLLVLVTRLERQAEAIAKLQARVRELDSRTVGSKVVGGRR